MILKFEDFINERLHPVNNTMPAWSDEEKINYQYFDDKIKSYIINNIEDGVFDTILPILGDVISNNDNIDDMVDNFIKECDKKDKNIIKDIEQMVAMDYPTLYKKIKINDEDLDKFKSSREYKLYYFLRDFIILCHNLVFGLEDEKLLREPVIKKIQNYIK